MNITLFPEVETNFLDVLLGLLEKGSDEAFWNNLMGERVLKLMKRYFGSDVVFLGFIVYLAPLVGYYINFVFSWIIGKLTEKMFVSIQISQKERGYNAIGKFVASQTKNIQDLRTVEGRCESRDDDDDDDTQVPQLTLYPLNEVEHEVIYKGHKLWITQKKNGDTEKSHSFYSGDLQDFFSAMNSNPCIQITMRGQNLDKLRGLIQEWVDEYYEKINGKLTISKCVPTRYCAYEWIPAVSKELRPIDSVILKDGQKEKIIKDIQTFRQREKWYTNRGIPYRRGYLLYGPPGTGKTSLVQSVASKVSMNVAIISLSGAMNDEKFSMALQEIPRNSILVIEDIDHCTIKDPSSDNEGNDSKLTMSGLLNALDGATAQEGSMVFMTCNDINRLQPALLRPGRIDVKMELGYADKTQIHRMFMRFLSDDEVPTKRICELADQFTQDIPDLTVTPAELQNFFIVNVMDKEDREDFEYIIEAIPAFLETVKKDRLQALEYKASKKKL
ncbi:hypothetical protein G6F56_007015 [Rhizopus delemar]|uniref:Mitochondrial chaperone n=1 Tax=Rhizopus stolonifer TaxID=4846 RepID=A0A367J472_RHIST|nr:hypothetical protein G6F56_007015 [Rhizopus delemar]RCH84742.1 mitochondrial chaperone [Rhizopus stolonifer]